MTGKWLVVQAVLLEVAGISALLLLDPEGWTGLLTYLLLHLLATVLFSLFVFRLLPARYRTPLLPTFSALITLQYLIPVIGPVGTLLGILLALYLPRHNHQPDWMEIAIPELPYQPVSISSEILYSHGGLTQVLREAGDPDKRLRAVMASKHINEKDHVRILRQALKDPVDDVRLLAYAMLDEKEKKISERINRHQQQLKRVSAEKSLPVVLRLAQDYWEMAYLGLAQGGVRLHFLNRAKDLLLPLVENRADAMASRMLGRIYLALEQWEEAEDHLLLALDLGVEPHQVLPYLAEAAFNQRRFDKVNDYLTHYAESSVVHPGFSSVVKFWLEQTHVANAKS